MVHIESYDILSNAYVTINVSPKLFSLHNEIPVDKKKRTNVTSGRKSLTMDCVLLPESVFFLSEKPLFSLEGHLDNVLNLSWSKTKCFLSSLIEKTSRLRKMASNKLYKEWRHLPLDYWLNGLIFGKPYFQVYALFNAPKYIL